MSYKVNQLTSFYACELRLKTGLRIMCVRKYAMKIYKKRYFPVSLKVVLLQKKDHIQHKEDQNWKVQELDKKKFRF